MAEVKSTGFDFGKCLKDTFGAIKGVFVKPASEGAKTIAELKDPKTGWIKNAFFLVAVVLINLINTVLGLIIVKTTSLSSFSLSSGAKTSSKVEFKFDNITSINYFEVIGKSLLLTAVFALVVAGIAYLVGLIFKKQANIAKLTGAILLSMVPAAVCGILATLVGTFWSEGAMFIGIAGVVFSFATMISLISKEVALEGDQLIFFHIVTIMATILVYWYVILKIDFFSDMLGLSSATALLTMLM